MPPPPDTTSPAAAASLSGASMAESVPWPANRTPGESASKLVNWFAEELLPHEPLLRAWLRSKVPLRSDLDDVVQESYLRLWRARTAAPIRSARAFLFRVAHNVAIDLLRRSRNSPIDAVADLSVLPVAAELPDAGACLTAAEKLQVLADAIARLPPRGRQLIVLCKLQGFTHRDAAHQLGISPKTVDEHISRSLKQLGAELRAHRLDSLFPS